MSSVDDDFNELVRKIEHGRDFTAASFEPVYYLVFHPADILKVKGLKPAWESRLRKKAFTAHFFSLADAIGEIHAKCKLRKIWLSSDGKAPFEWQKTNDSLKNALTPKQKGESGPLQEMIEAKLTELESEKDAILFVTDLEALHPYLRIGAIENQLYGQFKVPTVFLYPGVRSGKTRLSFLGIYPDDGNYRSVHVGG